MSLATFKTAIYKIADNVEMSFDISDAEKDLAEEAKIRFEAVSKRLNDASDHLDIIYDPFKRHNVVSTDSLIKRRGVLNRYKQKVKENFNEVKTIALLGIRKLNYFASGDTAIQEIINSFVDSVEDVEHSVEEFLDLIGDYESTSFRNDILSSVDNIRAQISILDTLIWDRVIEHIDDNILAKNWMSSKKDELKLELDEKIPLITELFEERQKALEPGNFPANAVEPQSLNTSDATKIHYPNHLRTIEIGG